MANNKNKIGIYIVSEDSPGSSVLSHIIHSGYSTKYIILKNIIANGKSKLLGNLKKYNDATENLSRVFLNDYSSFYCFLLTDLDEEKCAPILISKWFTFLRHERLILRVAVREIESWLLADRKNFSDYFSISLNKIPHNPDCVSNPKGLILNLMVNYSVNKIIKEQMVRIERSNYFIGRGYNDEMTNYIFRKWNFKEAIKNSDSLRKLVEKLAALK
jgi:hypothetical protein